MLKPVITGPEIAQHLRMTYEYFRRKIAKQPDFPKPVRGNVYLLDEINEWMTR